MSAPVIEDRDGRRVFRCPGCDELHSLDARWTVTGPDDRPTASPSLLTRAGHYVAGQAPGAKCWCTYEERIGKPAPFKCVVCHLFMRDGQLQFLGDSTHHLAGQTVPMEPLE